jgi:hypothetical protein
MSRFTVYAQDNAPEASKPILGDVKKAFGFVPNLQATGSNLRAGDTRRNVLEVVLGVATKVMSNYTNHLVDTQPDKFMAGNEWTRPDAA